MTAWPLRLLVLAAALTVGGRAATAAAPSLTTSGSAAGFTQDQRDYLQATMNTLSSMGRDDLANRINEDVKGGRVLFGDCGAGTLATVNAPWGYLSRAHSNVLTIDNGGLRQWVNSRKLMDKAAKKNRPDLVDKGRKNMRDAINSIALTLTHEYIHMDQYAPQQIPKYEDPAYTHGISEMRRVIRDRMGRIQEILDRNADQPGDADRLSDLLEDLETLRDIYSVSVESMHGDKGVIKQGQVTATTFSSARSDKDKMVNEVNGFINTARNSQQHDPSPPATGGATDSGNTPTQATSGDTGTKPPVQAQATTSSSLPPGVPLLPPPAGQAPKDGSDAKLTEFK